MEGNAKTIMFICDRKACVDCRRECQHTTNIEHAVGFKKEMGSLYVEQFNKDFFIKLISAAFGLTITSVILALGFKFVTWLMF